MKLPKTKFLKEEILPLLANQFLTTMILVMFIPTGRLKREKEKLEKGIVRSLIRLSILVSSTVKLQVIRSSIPNLIITERVSLF